MKFKVFLSILFIVFIQSLALAQTIYSPYTRLGIGEVRGVGVAHNMGMGGIGISNGSFVNYNSANPALLYKNSLSVFSIGMLGEYREVSTSELSQKNYIGGFDYAILGFPLMLDKWTIGLGIMPFSTVNYKFNTTVPVTGNPESNALSASEGSGGFNKAFLSSGFKITKRFSAGFTIGYLFGSIKNEVATQVQNDSLSLPIGFPAVVTDRLTIGDLYLMGGLAYQLPINKQTAVNFGLTYEMGGKKDVKIYQNIRNGSFREISNVDNDTTIDTRGAIKLPSTVGFGFSFEKRFNWTVGADIQFRNWSDYQDFSGRDSGFENNYTVSVGAEFIPDVASVDNYLKRMAYRIGVTQQRSPFQVNDEYINDFGINFGVALPVRSFSSFDLSFQLGQRGSEDNDLIKERYFKVLLGVTFNDKWFIRRKFD